MGGRALVHPGTCAAGVRAARASAAGQRCSRRNAELATAVFCDILGRGAHRRVPGPQGIYSVVALHALRLHFVLPISPPAD
eukprot:1132189-Alexandrium_andersonii.AAC.1